MAGIPALLRHCDRRLRSFFQVSSLFPSSSRVLSSLLFFRRISATTSLRIHTDFIPGQGVQKVGMLQPWIDAFPKTTAPLIEEVDSLLGYKLSQIIQDGPNSLLTATIHSQPAIMAASIIILRVLEQEYGFHPPSRSDYALGHSLGEFAAFTAAGHCSFADSLYLVRRREIGRASCRERVF